MSATTDTPSTSGEGVDVLDTIQKFANYFDGGAPMSRYAAWNRELIETKLRIAELIEAAEATAVYEDIGYDEIERLRKAIAALRATQGAHR